jgi:hypothetical protein
MRAYGLHEAAVLPGPLFFSCYVPVLCLLFWCPLLDFLFISRVLPSGALYFLLFTGTVSWTTAAVASGCSWPFPRISS